MSVSIIVDGALWGLIACHHYSPRSLSMNRRIAAEIFGEFFALQLGALTQKQMLLAAENARDFLNGVHGGEKTIQWSACVCAGAGGVKVGHWIG